jgi:hypothetical protein
MQAVKKAAKTFPPVILSPFPGSGRQAGSVPRVQEPQGSADSFPGGGVKSQGEKPKGFKP